MSNLKLKVKSLILKLFVQTHTSLDWSKLKTIHVTEQDISLLKSSNHVLKTPLGYFRWCRLHNSKTNYIVDSLKIFSCCLKNNNQKLYVNQIIESLIQGHSTYKDLLNENVAFIDFHPQGLHEIHLLSQIKEFLSVELRAYYQHTKKNSLQTLNANKTIAYEHVARMLGIGDYVPKTEFIRLSINNNDTILYGTLMQPASGIYPLKLGNHVKTSISPLIQQKLLNLSILDAICNERDHRPGNYYLCLNNDNYLYDNISVFDNDGTWTFFPSLSVNIKTAFQTSKLIKNGEYNRPFIDVGIFKDIKKIKKEDLYILSPNLNRLQIFACWKRIQKIRLSMEKGIVNKNVKLLSTLDWNNLTIKEELSGRYGNTYLHTLIHWYEFIKHHFPNILEKKNNSNLRN